MSEKGKEAGIAVTAEELARINRFAKKELRAEEVYTFAVKLCDNEVDRDFERFDRAALEKLSELFVGRTGIFDHSWSAGGQTARIYRAEVIEEETRTTAGDKYCWCKGWAYMLRTEKNAELIAEIEGGIKKEVSVGCSAAKRSCSICGKDAGLCEHERGKYYGGKLCYAVLSDITDAYEWSFVAVPAQRAAGVVKRFGQSEGSLKAMVRACGSRAQVRELEELEKLSALGKSYLGALRRGVPNLLHHVRCIRDTFGLPCVVAINRFPTDTDREIALLTELCGELGVRVVLSTVWADGGRGGEALAREVVRLCETENRFRFAYELDAPVEEKITAVVRRVYGGAGAEILPAARRQIRELEALGFGGLPVCIAKTQASLSDDPTLLGAPAGFTVTVRSVTVSAGAGFLVALTGDVLTMPGLPKVPAAENIDVDDDGRITGLF